VGGVGLFGETMRWGGAAVVREKIGGRCVECGWDEIDGLFLSISLFLLSLGLLWTRQFCAYRLCLVLGFYTPKLQMRTFKSKKKDVLVEMILSI